MAREARANRAAAEGRSTETKIGATIQLMSLKKNGILRA